jgi:hypothetical protein
VSVGIVHLAGVWLATCPGAFSLIFRHARAPFRRGPACVMWVTGSGAASCMWVSRAHALHVGGLSGWAALTNCVSLLLKEIKVAYYFLCMINFGNLQEVTQASKNRETSFVRFVSSRSINWWIQFITICNDFKSIKLMQKRLLLRY